LNVERLVKAITAIACLTTLEIVALVQGVDGALFGIVIAAIAGLGGYVMGGQDNK